MQGKFRQKGGLEKENTSVTDAEDEETTKVPSVPILPKVKPRRGGTTPASVSTQLEKVAKKVTFAE